MRRLTFPGYTAEASLGWSRNRYRMAGQNDPFISNHVVSPQAKKRVTFTDRHCGDCHITSTWGFFKRTGKKWCHDETCWFDIDTDTGAVSDITCSDGPLYSVTCGWFGDEIA